MRDNFYVQIQDKENSYHSLVEELHTRIDELNNKVVQLQFRSTAQPQTQKLHVREEYHKEKLRHQEIQSLMLEKYSKYQNDINQHKRNNDRLIQELIKANKNIDELGSKNLQLEEQLEQF